MFESLLARTLVMLGEELAAEHGNEKAPEFYVQVQGMTREFLPLVTGRDSYAAATRQSADRLSAGRIGDPPR